MRQMLPLADQALVQLAGELRDAGHPRLVPEPVAGHADLAAATGDQHAVIEIGPALPGLGSNRRNRDHENPMRAYVCTSRGALGCRGPEPYRALICSLLALSDLPAGLSGRSLAAPLLRPAASPAASAAPGASARPRRL